MQKRLEEYEKNMTKLKAKDLEQQRRLAVERQTENPDLKEQLLARTEEAVQLTSKVSNLQGALLPAVLAGWRRVLLEREVTAFWIALLERCSGEKRAQRPEGRATHLESQNTEVESLNAVLARVRQQGADVKRRAKKLNRSVGKWKTWYADFCKDPLGNAEALDFMQRHGVLDQNGDLNPDYEY